MARRFDTYKSTGRPSAADLQWHDVRFFEHRLTRIRTDANHELLAGRATAHVTVDHEDERTHHFYFGDPIIIDEHLANTLSGFFVVGQCVSCSRNRRC